MTTNFSMIDSVVDKSINEAILMLPHNIQEAALFAMGSTKSLLNFRTLPDRVIAAIILSGVDAHDTELLSFGKIAASFEIQWAMDQLRRNSWCGINGRIQIPVAIEFGHDKARILGNALQSLSHSLVMDSTEQADYLIYVLKQLNNSALSLSESRNLFVALDTSLPGTAFILDILKKRAALFVCAALTNIVLFKTNPDQKTIGLVENFGISFGIAYQLWMQLHFVSEVQQGNHQNHESLVKQDFLYAYPTVIAMQIRANKIQDASTENQRLIPLDDASYTEGIEHTRDLLIEKLQDAMSNLSNANLPVELIHPWKNLIEDILLATQSPKWIERGRPS